MTTPRGSEAGVCWLLVILAVSLSLKLAVWWTVAESDPSRFFTHDSYSYHHSARALVELGSFAASPEQPEIPQTIRTPGYSVFLASVYAVFQARPETAIIAQILLSLATIVLVWRIAAERWDRRVALLSVLLLACDPNSLSHSLLLLTETLFTLLMCCLLWVAARFDRTTTEHRWALMLGLVLALATLVRPVSYYLALPLGRPFSFLTFIVFLTYLGVLYAGTARWLISNRRSGNTRSWDLCAWGIFLYLALISAGPEAYHRFRVPITPILCLYAAAALRPASDPPVANSPVATNAA